MDLSGTSWFYEYSLRYVAFVVLFGLILVNQIGFWAGRRLHKIRKDDVSGVSPEFLPSTTLGLLALLLGFTLSMSVSRFEARRTLAIDEANAIGTAYLRTTLIKTPERGPLLKQMSQYLDARIATYSAHPANEAMESLQTSLWKNAMAAMGKERGAIENGYASSMTAMFDLQNARSIALKKHLPVSIYWITLLISAVGLISFGYARGLRKKDKEPGQGVVIALMISGVFTLILDIERPFDGSIQINQEALKNVRASIDRLRAEH